MLLAVPILILLVSFSLADNGSPCHYRLFCVLFWVKTLSSQFLLLFQSFILSYIISIMTVRYMLISFQTLMSALRILTLQQGESHLCKHRNAEKCITRSKSNVIWQVFLGIRGPPGNLNQQQWFFPCHVKHYYSAASLTIFSRISGISSFIHSYDCCLFRSVFNFSLSRQLRISGLIDITKWWRNILFST